MSELPPSLLRSFVALLVALVLSPLAVQAQPQAADDAATLFDDSVVMDVRLRINSKDWQALTAGYQTDTFYPADFVWQDQVVRNVGIRSRGSGSRNRDKPGLKVDFNRYTSGQRFLGLNAVVLDNLTQDPAMLRERLAMKFFAHMGLLAPRETFVKVWINDQIYLGVYALVESMDKRFLRRAEVDADGYLYDYEYQDMWWFTHLGDQDYPYQIRFEAETNQDRPPAEHYGPIRQLLRAINEPRDIRRDIGAFLDVEAFLRYLAVEAFLAEWDGLAGDFGVNNFYLFRPSTSTQFTVVPWDKDNTFKSADYPIWPDGMNSNVLTAQLMNVNDLREFFLNAVLECAAAAEAVVEAADGQPRSWLHHEIETLYTLIAEAARADNRKPHNNDVFEQSVADLREFARLRPDFVRGAVARRR